MPDRVRNTADRFSWAATVVSPKPSDQVLEVGCGVGLLVQKLAEKLTTGRLVAIDQSVSMIMKAVERNRIFIETGILQLYAEPYPFKALNDQQFDKIVSFNVSGFWKKPGELLSPVTKNLRENGKFYLFYQPPINSTNKLAAEAAEVLKANNFTVEEQLIQEFEPAPAFCLVARPEHS